MTATLLKTIGESGQSLCSIAAATGMDKSALGRFVAGKQSLRLDIADRLAAHFGLALLSLEDQTDVKAARKARGGVSLEKCKQRIR